VPLLSVQRPTFGFGTRVGHKPRAGPELLHCRQPSWCRDVSVHLYPWLEVRNPGGGAISGNLVSGCLYVDGASDGNCGFVDFEAPPDGNRAPQATSSHHTSGVGLGNHTEQTVIQCNAGCEVAYFHVNYRVYKPNLQQEHTQP
jgi:hypothetical protein